MPGFIEFIDVKVDQRSGTLRFIGCLLKAFCQIAFSNEAWTA